MDFLIGGIAGVGAGLFSNPFDVVKTRMQLQGELRTRGQHAVHYKNIPHAMYTIVKHDGLSALQKGLVPALWFQLVVNGVRLGIYQEADNYGLLRDENNNTKFINSLVFGSFSGMMGGLCGSPLQLVKTQLMSYSSRKIAVGTQHAHPGMCHAMSQIYNKNGLSGLWRGAHGMMLRNSIGSSAQIASYSLCKEWMNDHDIFQQSRYFSAFMASNIGAIVKTIALTPIDVVTSFSGFHTKMKMDFLIGGIAGVGAGLFSNPFDVVKTRMQLQGELRTRGQHAVHYKNIPHAMYTIVKHDGLSALQKGLVPALWFQLVVNGVRLGIYQEADNYGLLRDENNNTKFINSLVFGSFSGMMGGLCGSPLQLVKTQLMSYSSRKIAVGTQHAHPGMCHAMSQIYNKNGLSGLWRGAHGMMLRNSIGSSAQIASYSLCKEWMNDHDIFQQSRYFSAFMASNIGAIVKTIALTPIDVVMTRLYNQGVDAQGRGVLYTGLYDCSQKISKTEGYLAFYKGIGPSYFRQAPHSVLLLVFWDILKDYQKSFQSTK